VKGERREIFKDPVTDNGDKKSARGLLRVEREYVLGPNGPEGKYTLYDQQTEQQAKGGELRLRFKDGNLFSMTNLGSIRSNVTESLK
jgi:nicotinamide phosphoribosyltransferase